MSLKKCKKIILPKIASPEGSLTFLENNMHVPFNIKRVFYIYDVPTAENRGAHAHKKLEEVLICLSGSFDIELDDGQNKNLYHLNRPWEGLYLSPMVWYAAVNFGPGTTCLALCSDKYKEDDYIRDYQTYLEIVNN